jgi:hypothetical protein
MEFAVAGDSLSTLVLPRSARPRDAGLKHAITSSAAMGELKQTTVGEER